MNVNMCSMEKRLNSFLKVHGFGDISLRECMFAMDKDIEYEIDGSVRCENIFYWDEAAAVIAEGVSRQTSWIHANVLNAHDGLRLVSLRLGPKGKNLTPSINVSLETRKFEQK